VRVPVLRLARAAEQVEVAADARVEGVAGQLPKVGNALFTDGLPRGVVGQRRVEVHGEEDECDEYEHRHYDVSDYDEQVRSHPITRLLGFHVPGKGQFEGPEEKHELCGDEGEEEFVVPLTHAVGHPEAVMVELPHASPAIPAMFRPHRFFQFAESTPLMGLQIESDIL